MENTTEKVAWAKFYNVSEELSHSIYQDDEYITTLIKSFKGVKGNKMATSLIDMFLWEFVDIKVKLFTEPIYDYTTTVTYDEDTIIQLTRSKKGIIETFDDPTDRKLKPWIHKDPRGNNLYRTKKNKGGHIKLKRFVIITKKDFVVDFDNFKFKFNDSWEFIITKKSDEDNDDVDAVKGYWKKK